jgi:predicted nucleic acid-binding protein
MIVVDSSVWISQLRSDRSEAVVMLESIVDSSMIVVGDLVLFEVLRGARDDTHALRLAQNLQRFTILPMTSEKVAIDAANHSRALRSKGVTVRKAVDILIAAFCIENGFYLLHQDRDFDLIARHLDLKLL